ncbi:hypothetical protein [Streptomyces sp. NPDC047981]|uniref:hypothetical protein n=1 Tax=Streptomyces sp. NPDC047981 TaxID=3154610 RepID=UPI00341FD413
MRMNQMYQQALDGTLTSQITGNTGRFTFANTTEIPLGGYLVSDTGVWLGVVPQGNTFGPGNPAIDLEPGEQWRTYTTPLDFGSYFVFVNRYSGAFALVFPAMNAQPDGPNWNITIDCSCLLDPNDIGIPPTPNAYVIVPPDSPRVVVGCGVVNGNTVAREQYWRRLPQSYSIAKGEVRTESYTTSSGIEATSSQQADLATSVGVSASAGWGPISTSLSASVSAGSSTFQQVTTNTQSTSFLSESFDNTAGESAQMYLYWGLTNVVTIFDATGTALSSFIYGSEDPAVIDGPRDPLALPPRPLEKTMPMSPRMARLLRGEEAVGDERRTGSPR